MRCSPTEVPDWIGRSVRYFRRGMKCSAEATVRSGPHRYPPLAGNVWELERTEDGRTVRMPQNCIALEEINGSK